MESISGPEETVQEANPTLDQDCRAALGSLYANTPKSRGFGKKPAGILVFSQVIRAGFIGGVVHGAEKIDLGMKLGAIHPIGAAHTRKPDRSTAAVW
jgi:hypothetical protein